MCNIKRVKIITLLLLLTVNSLFARIFFVGSNPHLSVFAFPQDILLTGTDFAYYYTTYQKDPWWGDIDQPSLRPNNTYLKTGENIDEGAGGSNFEHNSYYNMYKQYVGFGRGISETARTRFDLTYLVRSMRNKASGTFAGGTPVTFEYSEHHSIQEIYLRSILALKIRELPVGFMIGLGGDYATHPDLEFEYTRGGTSYNSNMLIWAWSTESPDIDTLGALDPLGGGRLQDRYAMGPLFRLDVQAATTLPRLKFGGRFRFRYGLLDQYVWNADEADYEGDRTKKIRNFTGRIYGNYNWVKREKIKFNTLVLSRYTHVDSIGALTQNLAVEDETEVSRNFVFQINPNFNIYPWEHRMCYIDFALLCNYSHYSYDFLEDRYVSGGYKEDYVPTRVILTEDYPWYDYSYGKQNFFELALDVNMVLPIFGSKNQNVALGVTLLLWRRFLWFNKYHGGYPNDPATFEVENIRKNFDMETWLNSFINIIYRRGGYTFRFDVGQPLIYNLTPRTRITDAGGENVLYEWKKESMWLSQSGVRLGLFVSTGLKNIFRRRFQQEEEQF
jgi:hypothetical protein